MQCKPVFCLGTKHEPLNPVLHFNHGGLFLLLELFHLVNCFEFHVGLGFAGIKGGYAESASSKFYRSWVRITTYVKFSFKSTLTSMISEYFHMRWRPWVSFMWPVSTWLFSALILRAMLCTVLQQTLTKANLWFSANPMCHLRIFKTFVLISVWVSQGKCQKNYPMYLAPQGHTLLWCGEIHSSKGNDGCLSEPA